MMLRRFFTFFVLGMLWQCLPADTSFAGFGFGFGGNDADKSGLDFIRGYDPETVTTVTGRVVGTPHGGESNGTFIDVQAGGELVMLQVGPASYWEKNGIPVRLNDEVSAKGSKAQGKDGKSYLITRELKNKTAGASAEVRGDRGEPLWGSRSVGGVRSERSGGGMGGRSGGMRFRGGMMMRH